MLARCEFCGLYARTWGENADGKRVWVCMYCGKCAKCGERHAMRRGGLSAEHPKKGKAEVSE